MRGPACPTFEELSRLFSARNREVIAAHLSTCASCARAWSDLEALREAALEIPTRSVSPAEAMAMEDAIVTAALLPKPQAGRWRRWVAPVAAAAIAASATALFMTRSPPARTTVVEAERGARYEHFARTAKGASEVVRVREGRVTIAAPSDDVVDLVEVVTGDGTIEVNGSSFEVVVVDDRLTEVFVRTGQVAVHVPDGPTRIVRLGERWTRSERPAEGPSASARPSDPDGRSPGASDDVDSSREASDPLARVASRGAREAASSSTRDASGGVAGAPSALAPTASRSTRSASSMAPDRSGGVSGSTATRASTPASSTAHEASRGAPAASSANAPVESREAGSSGADAAASSASTPGLEDATATPPLPTPAEHAFASGWRALREGDTRRAAERFAEVLTHQPGGALAEDARYWRAVALARGDDAEATAAMRAYLANHATGRRAPEVALMLAWRRLGDGDESEARALFERAHHSGDDRVKAAAKRGLDRLQP